MQLDWHQTWKVTGNRVTHLLRIRKVLTSNLKPEFDYHDLRIFVAFLSPSRQMSDTTTNRSWPLPSLFLPIHYSLTMSRDSAVGIATGYGLDDREVGVRVPVGSRILSSPRRPDQLWEPTRLLSNGYWWLFPWGWSGRGVKLTTHLQLVPRSRKRGSIHLYIQPPIRLHGVLFN
jgi:hypothetical protein